MGWWGRSVQGSTEAGPHWFSATSCCAGRTLYGCRHRQPARHDITAGSRERSGRCSRPITRVYIPRERYGSARRAATTPNVGVTIYDARTLMPPGEIIA